ncbi:MAG: YciI family protein [Gemmatimonadales bacterium]
MRYLIFIASGEKFWATRTMDEITAIREKYVSYGESLKADGHYVMGGQLQRTIAATTFRRVNGVLEVVNGPFAETEEQIGGFYLIEAKDLDEALAVVERCPGIEIGSVELRPVLGSLMR